MAHAFAFDREPSSSRRYDTDGRLHVDEANISKSNVCEYLGEEIPEWRSLGLDPRRLYPLFRPPDELRKAAKTFDNLPLLREHVPVTADAHRPELVVGSTGTDAKFDAPYLTNSLVVWTRPAIDAVENETRRELSSAYHYRCDLTPGTWQGEAFAGCMRDLIGNHVALIPRGRVGHDIIIGDAAPRFRSLPKLASDSERARRSFETRHPNAARIKLAIF
jgi:hypothetical protein